jgi:hypothetical protein
VCEGELPDETKMLLRIRLVWVLKAVVHDWSAPAVQTGSNPTPGISTYRNVTAIATASGGVAIEAGALGPNANASILARNVIARGCPRRRRPLLVRTISGRGGRRRLRSRDCRWQFA